MKRRVTIITLVISVTSLLLLGGFKPLSEQESDNISVLFILDNSGSMANNDPFDLRYSAARLFTSLLNEGDAVGALIFANDAQAITNNIEMIQSQDGKNNLAKSFQPVTADGYTDVKAAFTLAETMLNAQDDRPQETVIIFLTDGEPEPLSPYADYIKDTIDLAESLNTPVLSIALTRGAATNFLTDLATATNGQMLQADTALDLLDAFLQILGNLKDRTILGEGVASAPTSVEIPIDAGLIPYIKQVSFIVSKDETVTTSLIDPEGQLVPSSDPRVSFKQLDDPTFTIMTLDNVTGGIWTVNMEGVGAAQVRGILNASLRAEILNPADFSETGTPLLITTHVVEETAEGQTNRVIGDASFYAEITSPVGEIESLDQFYDDGSHGDEKASDGIYSREYVNTETSGTYTIKVLGTKDLVPLQDQSLVTLIPFPEIEILSPDPIRYNLGNLEEILIEMRFIGGDGMGIDAGTPKAFITDKNNITYDLNLSSDRESYQTTFLPQTSGVFTCHFIIEDGFYKTLPYTHTEMLEFTVNIVPKITFDLNTTNLALGRVERLAISRGIPLSISVSSTADHAVSLNAQLEGISGLTIESPDQVTVPPDSEAALKLILKGTSDLETGDQEGQIVFSTDEEIDLSGSLIPLSVSVFDPTISILDSTPLSCSTPTGCLNWASQLTFRVHSTSKLTETLAVELIDNNSMILNKESILVVPGTQQINLTLMNDGWLSKGERNFELLLTPEREGVVVSGDTGGTPGLLIVPTLFSMCKRIIIWGSIGVVLAIIIISAIIKNIHHATRKPRVNGTLQYWHKDTPEKIEEVDMTSYKRIQLTLGSDPSCEIIIAGHNLEKTHVIFSAEKSEGEINIILTPVGEVHQGFSKVIGDLCLENEMKFMTGEVEYRYLSDSGY